MHDVFFQITVVIFLAAFLSIVFRFLKQPSILAFIITGIIVGPLGPFHFNSTDLMRSLAEIGITLLLFMIGLELNIKELKSVGKIAAVAGSLQIFLTSIAGYVIASLLGFSFVESFYIGIALAFSSTIVIIKLLSDKRDLKSLYGKITIGILLIQDLVAIFTLIVLSTLNSGQGGLSPATILITGLKVVVLFGWVMLLSRKVLPRLLNSISRSSESLFLFSLAWAFGIAALVSAPPIGFSIEIGGLLAGVALAGSIESYQIVTKVKPLRDFFLTIFFVTLGMDIVFSNIGSIIVPVLAFSAFILVLSPIIVMIILGGLRYKKRTSFFTGVALAQVSEFSLIIVFLGNKVGLLDEKIISIITFVGVITFVLSTYFIVHSNSLFKLFSPILSIFQRGSTNEEAKEEKLTDHTILVGANRMGESILDALVKKKQKVVVVDFDPDIIASLNEKGIDTFFGDITDPEIQEAVSLHKASLIISTVSDPEDNLLLLKSTRHLKVKPKILMAAFEKADAVDFYKGGADYVILPHIAGGNHIAKILVENDELEILEKYKQNDMDKILKP